MILFQNNYFEDEEPFWKEVNAKIIHGLCRAEDIDAFEPIIARGTIAFHKSVEAELRFKKWPNLMWPFNNDWHKYSYSYFSELPEMLNSDRLFSESDIEVSNYLKENGPQWIRSDSGSKIFSGGVFTFEQFQIEREYFNQHNYGKIKFVIAKPKEIQREWRLIIINNKIVDASMYMYKGETNEKRGVPNDLLIFADDWRKMHEYILPHSYVLDVCDSGGKYFCIELNNALTSGWYACDIEKIVKEIVKNGK